MGAMSRAKSGISSMRTVRTFLTEGACSYTLFHVLNRAFGHPLPEEERAADQFAGGIAQHGYQCGMLWGAALAAGAQAFRLYGATPQAEAKAIAAARRLVASFRARYHEINCLEITGLDTSSSTMQMVVHFLVKGGTITCLRMAARYAPVARREIEAAFSEEQTEVPPAPVSCAAILARKMGLSEMHAVMVAGLAGGIGLCGGACGALGAGVWITVLKSLRDGARKVEFRSPDALAVIDRFIRSSDYEFECSKIVGRTFEGVSDHASYVCNGGCSKILDALAG
jgi:C_GCAxxG_C_C family probable redox protein